ncbi:UNVERIFIED_CONTAM: hypothetical protein RF648_19065 [Kocuria sp. CPCC 205274]
MKKKLSMKRLKDKIGCVSKDNVRGIMKKKKLIINIIEFIGGVLIIAAIIVAGLVN